MTFKQNVSTVADFSAYVVMPPSLMEAHVNKISFCVRMIPTDFVLLDLKP